MAEIAPSPTSLPGERLKKTDARPRREIPDRTTADASAPSPAAEPAETPAGPSILVVRSTPAAAIMLDGQPQGRTPATLTSVSAGQHTLVLTTDDGRTLQEQVTVGPGARVERDHRFPGFGSLSITSDVWVEVSVDGGPTQQTPLRMDKLVAGRHTLRASRPGYKEKVMEFEIQEGDSRRLNIALERP